MTILDMFFVSAVEDSLQNLFFCFSCHYCEGVFCCFLVNLRHPHSSLEEEMAKIRNCITKGELLHLMFKICPRCNSEQNNTTV